MRVLVAEVVIAEVAHRLGGDFLPGAFGYDASCSPDPVEAATILWLDAFVANIDRSWRNPNLLVWHRRIWAIDHGAALYFHHGWSGGVTAPERFAQQPYDASNHVLSAYTRGVDAAHARAHDLLDPEVLADAVAQVPDAWIEPVPGAEAISQVRAAYVSFLIARLQTPSTWLPRERAA